jgi:hypothetical protein
MSIDPLKRIPKREEQLKTEPKNHKGIKLYDIDFAIAEHMIDTVMPTIEVMGEKVKVPVIYGNPERWKAIKKDGFLRDRNGQVQIPVCVFKRNSVARDESGAISMNRNLFYTAVSQYSKKHKYDRFSQMTSARRPVDLYNVTIPDYVTITYEVNIWTDFTEHMNKIVEAFQYATDEYWGDKNGFKFRVKIDSFDNTTEVGEGTQRIVRTTFTMLVDAYLLPEKFDNEFTTKKEISPKKIVWAGETDLTGGPMMQKIIQDTSGFTYSPSYNFIQKLVESVPLIIDSINQATPRIIENLNALFIQEGLTQAKRIVKLSQIAIQQLTLLQSKSNQTLENLKKLDF